MAAPGLSRVRLSMKMEGEKMTVYEREIEKIAKSNLPWEDLEGKTVFISGATGMIGKCLIDVLMLRNTISEQKIRIVALSRNK